MKNLYQTIANSAANAFETDDTDKLVGHLLNLTCAVGALQAVVPTVYHAVNAKPILEKLTAILLLIHTMMCSIVKGTFEEGRTELEHMLGDSIATLLSMGGV